MIVTLSFQEMTTAAHIGVRRQIMALANGRKDFVEREDRKGFESHIIGAMAELAVAREFNLYWNAVVGSITACDVGDLIEVRCRTPESGLDLPMRPHDKFDKPHVLVHARLPEFDLVGWLGGSEAWKLAEPYQVSAKLRFCPASMVRPITELKEELRLKLLVD